MYYYPWRKWEKADEIGKIISDNAVILCSAYTFWKKKLLTTFIILRWKSEYWGKGKSHGVQSIHTEFCDLKCSISLETYFSFNSRHCQYDQEHKTSFKCSCTVIGMVFQTQKAESIIYYQCGRVEIAWKLFFIILKSWCLWSQSEKVRCSWI